MKKMIAVVTALFLLGALSACGEKKDNLEKPNPETCNHEWVDATCTESKSCKICGKKEGVANGHTWLEATCTEAKTCEICGISEGEAL